jgi:tRNA-dihydrouridine synthase 1
MLKPALDVHESAREQIGRTPMFAETGMDAVRKVVQDLEEKFKVSPLHDDGHAMLILILQDEIEAAGPDWSAPSIDPVTGYRKLPSWVVQPVLRANPESTEVGGHEEFEPEEAAANGESTTAPPSPPAAGVNTAAKCIHQSPHPCSAVAAGKCETKACLIHCRLIRAVAGGMDPEEAATKNAKGELVGMGCEAHESKVRARGERNAEKRKHKAAAKEEFKRRKTAA